MAPFQYPQYRNPYVGSISDLMMRPAEAQAQAAQQSGQAWAGAARGIGQDVSGSIQQATDPRRQLEQVQVAETRKAITEGDTFKSILSKTPQVEENGMKLYDLPELTQQLTAKGIDPSTYVTHLAGINDAFRNQYAAQMAVVQTGAQALMRAPDPMLASHFVDMLVKNHTVTPEVGQQYQDLMTKDPSKIQAVASYFAGPQKPVMGKEGETPINPITGAPMGAPLPKTIILPRPGASAVTVGGPQSGSTVASSPLPPERPVIVPQGGTAITTTGDKLFSSPPAPRSLEEQMLTAITAGDTATADRISQTLQTVARAKQDPAAIAQAAATRALSAEAAQLRLDALRKANEPNDPAIVSYYADQLVRDPQNLKLVSGDKNLMKDVRTELASRGVDINNLDAASRTMAVSARDVKAMLPTIQTEAQQLDKLGLFGPIGARWKDFLGNKVGAGELAGGNKANAELIGKFRVDVGLLKTALLKAHVGSRGSGQLLQEFGNIINADRADLPSFVGGLNGVNDWMSLYAGRIPTTQEMNDKGAGASSPTANTYHLVNGQWVKQ